jgi:hypothetical protein
MVLYALLASVARADPQGIGDVALMTFAMEAPYGLQQVQGRRPDGSIVMTGNGAWFRAGYGKRNPAREAGQPGQPPAISGFQLKEKKSLVVDGHPATVTVGEAKLADGTPVVYFAAEITGATVAPFEMEAVVPHANGPAWLGELERTLGTVDLSEE